MQYNDLRDALEKTCNVQRSFDDKILPWLISYGCVVRSRSASTLKQPGFFCNSGLDVIAANVLGLNT